MPFETRELQKFSSAGRAIAEAAEVSFEHWATGEGGVILKEWAGEVRAGSTDEARLKSRSKAAQITGVRTGGLIGVRINTGRRGGQPGEVFLKRKKWSGVGHVSDDGGLSYKWRHYKASDWAKFSEAMADYAQELRRLIPFGQKAVALARQSVIQIADALGIVLETVVGGGNLSGDQIAKAREAVSQDGKQYINGTGIKTKTDTEFTIEMINRYPGIQEAGIGTALERVVLSRLGFHIENLYSVLKRDTASIARAYPYLEVT